MSRERQESEQRILRLTRVLQMLSGINTAVLRIREQRELLVEACRIAYQVGHYAYAFVALIESVGQVGVQNAVLATLVIEVSLPRSSYCSSSWSPSGTWPNSMNLPIGNWRLARSCAGIRLPS